MTDWQTSIALANYRQKLHEHCHIKRFYERWNADPDFKSALAADTQGTLDQYDYRVALDDIDFLLKPWNPQAPVIPSGAVRSMWEIVQTKNRWVQQFYKQNALPANSAMAAWRRRQINRQRLELGPFVVSSNIQSSLAVELTQGCSVGCWFCALSPDSYKGAFLYHDENRGYWQAALDSIDQRLGPAAQSGFLYWATDPLDNPDYEKFCLDYYERIGVFPPTTTALALKNPARTRALLQMSEARGCWLNRFSVLTLRLMQRVHAEFSAEELALVECLPLNKQANMAYGNAGRFRERALKQPELLEHERAKFKFAPWYTSDPGYAESADYAYGSIACVTGFLINMVTGTMQLISPCTASDQWPLGYIVFDERRFSNAEQLDTAMTDVMACHMPDAIPADTPLRFHAWLDYEPHERGFQLSGRFHQCLIFQSNDDARQGERLATLGSLLNAGTYTTRQIVAQLENQLGVERETTMVMLTDCYDAGVFVDTF
jgi:radical SAM family RiPP maturation amino acid epimerase